uniref:DUF4218 domain-containing protein n=1 Tax=Tanacetum cinerariifolium TaxID=118510 RepID=A0A699H7U4_TANCI|nr:hypothetical protein [Tanacetum cinerariifolium]
MVFDAAGPSFNPLEFHDSVPQAPNSEPPNSEAKRFYDLLSRAKEPLYKGCEKHSTLSAMSRLLNIKSDFNISQSCYDCITRNKDGFIKGRVERDEPPPRLSGEEIWSRVLQYPKVTEQHYPIGKEFTGFKVYHNWTKRSILWDLPYWHTNLIRHNLDVMHVEKNMFDNIFNTIMDDNDKTNDNGKARQDVVLQWVEKLKFPDGYASNLSRCTDVHKGKMFGMKNHDCHVFMERLLPIAFREMLPEPVWKAMMEVSLYFRDVCSTTLKVDELEKMEKNIMVTLYKLEKILPPGFFDHMEHLVVHVSYEARVGAPVQYRWMYPFERYLYHLKKKVKNKARVESSICEAYIMEEISNFCSHYFDPHALTNSTRVKRNDDGGNVNEREDVLSIFKHLVRPSGNSERRYLNDDEIFEGEVKLEMPNITNNQLVDVTKKRFGRWLRDYVHNPENQSLVNHRIQNIALGPSRDVITYPMCYVNGFSFHTMHHSSGRKTINTDLCLIGEEGESYGYLMDIIEVDYIGCLKLNALVLFKCDWFDHVKNQGWKVRNEFGLVDINQKKKLLQYDPFIMAHQAHHLYFIDYPSVQRDKIDWWAVCRTKAKSTIVAPAQSIDSAYQEDGNTIPFIVIEHDEVKHLANNESDMQEVEIEQLTYLREEEKRLKKKKKRLKKKMKKIIMGRTLTLMMMMIFDVHEKNSLNITHRVVLSLRWQLKSFMTSKGVTRNIATIWKLRFTGAWDTWKKVSKEERDVWINLFKNKYRWNPSIEVDVRRMFNKIGSKCFSNCMSKERKKAEKPEFMNQVTCEALCGVWRLPAFVAISERGKTARQSNKRLHTGGSIPISEHKTKLNKKTNVFVDATAKATWEGYNAVHGADDTLDAQSGNDAKMFPKWIDRVGSKNETAYGVGDVDEYVCQPNIEEPSAHNIPNVEIVQLVDLVKVQQVEHNLLKTGVNNLKNAHEAQSKKLDQVVKAQSSSEKQLRKFVAQEVGKVVANEVGKAVAEEVGKATKQILNTIRI